MNAPSPSPFTPEGPRDYSLLLLGDAHYDTAPESVYHAHYDEPDERLNRIQREEFARNADMWAERCPRLLRAAAAAVRPDTAFAIQLGDAVQGDCGDPAVHRRMLADAFGLFKHALGPLPLLAVTGNHDIRGPGAPEAAHAFLADWMARETGLPQDASQRVRTIPCGPDAFLFVDFNDVAPEELFAAIDATAGARHLFLATHGPFVPRDTPWPRWCLLGKPEEDAARRELHRRLLARRAIVLAGHTHFLTIDRCERDGGLYDQIVIHGVWSEETPAGPVEWLESSPEEYGRLARPQADAATLAYLADFGRDLTRHFYADSVGFALLRVSDAGVALEYHAGDAAEPTLRCAVRP